MNKKELYRAAKSFYGRPPNENKFSEEHKARGIFQSHTEKDFMNMDENSTLLTVFEYSPFLVYIADRTVERGELISFSVGKETYNDKGDVTGFIKSRREYLANDTYFKNENSLARTGLSIVATAYNFEYLIQPKSITQGTFSDLQDNTYNTYTFGDFTIISSINQAAGLGFFPKKLLGYDNRIETYNFNDNDEDLFCPFTALYKQDEHKILPLIINKDSIYDFYEKSDFVITDDFHLSEERLNQLYRNFAKYYNLNIVIKIFYFKAHDEYIKPEDDKITNSKYFNNFRKTLRLINDKNSPTCLKPPIFHVARVRGHVFNLKGGKCTKILQALRYLYINNCIYNTLENKDKDIKKISRKMAIEYNENRKSKLNNPSKLLEDFNTFTKDSYCEKPKERKERVECALTSLGQDMDFVFFYDLETTNDENNKFTIYSYYCASYRVPDWYKETYGDIKDDFYFTYKSNIVHNSILHGEKVAIVNSPIITMLNRIINNVPDNANVILFAHNGSNFDNVIARELMMSTLGFYDLREVCTGPNQGILLSLECNYSYYRNKVNTKRYTGEVNDESFRSDFKMPYSEDNKPVIILDQRKLKISMRDSKKIINYPVASLPNTFGFKEYKLPYDYNFYQNFINRVESGEISQYKIKNGLYQYYWDKTISSNTESTIREIMKDDFTKEFIDQYIEIINGTYTNKLEDGEFKTDILKYIDYLKNVNVCYDVVNYCLLYNKYDVKVCITAMRKFQEHINALETKDSLCKMVVDHALTKYNTKDNLLNEYNKKDSFAVKIIDTIKQIKNNNDNLTINGASQIEVYKFRSLASIVFSMCKNYGVYDNIYKLKGDLKLFIQKAVVGGRVMTNYHGNGGSENKIKNYEKVTSFVGKDANQENIEIIKGLVNDDAILDFDAVSLYPSAISILGMPAGAPYKYDTNNKTIKEILTELIISNKRFYICCDIETTKDLDYPILSEMIEKDNAMSRSFRNGKFEQIVIGDLAMKDVIRYQKAKITKIYDVVVFPELCYNFSNFIKCLFNLRLLLKAIGLPCQETIKTLMSSAYGRTILKNSEYKSNYHRCATNEDKTKFNNYLSKNFHLIKPEINCYGLYKKISQRDGKKPEGYPHVGAAILEKSRSLMHNAFNLLEDEVFYTDTDSIHMKAKDLHKVKSMIGKNMCQFHSDFDPSRKNDPIRAVDPETGIFAIHSVFVMKKCYYDELFGIDKNNKFCIREHKRAKGIPTDFLDKEKYLGLLNGEVYECDLSKYHSMLLKKDKNGQLIKIKEFKRTVRRTQ